MKKDLEIQKNAMDQLKSIPSLHAEEIGVSSKNGIVALSGIVDSYPKKIAAERAVLKVKGVHGVADGIQVKLNGTQIKSDAEIAQAALYAVEWHSGLDIDRIKILVDQSVVTLEGEVDWNYQRKMAQKTLSNIIGVKRIINNIKIVSRPLPDKIKEKIHSAFVRNANIDSANIKVSLDGNKVVLSGKVKCWAEKEEAENSVWTLPGVTEVENQLKYEDSYDTSEII